MTEHRKRHILEEFQTETLDYVYDSEMLNDITSLCEWMIERGYVKNDKPYNKLQEIGSKGDPYRPGDTTYRKTTTRELRIYVKHSETATDRTSFCEWIIERREAY